VAIATQTLSLAVKDSDTKSNARHFTDAGDGEACDTDQKNAAELEHGVMCIEGLECMDHGGEKMCMEAHGSGSSVLSSFSITVLITFVCRVCSL